jgi:glycosyltransferase involved in cell wall biosynthesis
MPTDLRKLKVAVVHDWLNGFRGGEQVLDAILETFPQAELFTLFYTPGTLNERIEKRPIHSSFLNHLPKNHKYYRFLLPLFPMAIERLNVQDFDLVLSSSHCVAKGIIPNPRSLHICYSFTPMRYAWDRYLDYFGGSFLEPLFYPFLHYLRMWDISSSNRVDYFLTLSQWVKNRIHKYYRRDSHVIYPFANLEHFRPSLGEKGDYYLIVSAFAPYKRVDLAIQACQKLERRLVIIGAGQDESKLKSLAGPTTEFLGRAPLAVLSEMYAGAKALLFPGQEDFGITPLEAMASGTPVIAFKQGGVTETVVEGETGLFFSEQTVESLCESILKFEAMPVIPKEKCVSQAALFSREAFLSNFQSFVSDAWEFHHRKESDSNLPIYTP